MSGVGAAAAITPKKKRQQIESQHQQAFFARLRLKVKKYPWLAFAFAVPNSGRRDAISGARLKSEGMLAGVADIVLPFPRNGYHGAFIEMKTGENKPTVAQKEFLSAMIAQGYAICVAYGVDEAVLFTENYLGIKL